MFQICFKHQEVTTWGCRQCLNEELGLVVDESAERLRVKFSEILSDQLSRPNLRRGVKK